MTAPTVPLTVDLNDFGGSPCPDGTRVTATLDLAEVYQGFIVPTEVRGTTTGGIAVLNVFPNAPAPTGLGTKGSIVTIRAQWSGAKPFHALARVPNVACRLEECQLPDDFDSSSGSSGTGSSEDLTLNLLGWAFDQAWTFTSITRDDSGAVISASIRWPDGMAGTFTGTPSLTHLGAIDSWQATYEGATGTKTAQQPTVTRNADGAVTNQPTITIT